MPMPLRMAPRAARITEPAMPCAPPTIASRLRVPLCAAAAIGGTASRTMRASISGMGSPGVRRRLAEPDVRDDDRAGRVAIDEQAAFHRPERDGEIGAHARARRLAGGGVEAARHVERDDAHAAPPAGTLEPDAPDRVGDRAMRRAARTRAEQAVDDHALGAVGNAVREDGARGLALGDRVAACATRAISATRTRTPRRASSAATTHASPPLLPGPA